MTGSRIICTVALLAAVLAPGASFAAGRHDLTEHRSVGGSAPLGPPSNPGCVPLCSTDTSPCDPPNFKVADGRCIDPFSSR